MIAVELEDTDMLGVIYGPRILVWTSRVFQRSLVDFGLSLKTLIESGIHLPIFKSSCEILLPLTLGDQVETKLQVIDRRERSFAFEVAFFLENRPAAHGSMVHVCIDATSREKKALPKPITLWLDAVEKNGLA